MLAAAATGVQVGAAIVASRCIVAEVPPLTLAMLRYAIGFLCLLPFVRVSIRPRAGHRTATAIVQSPAGDLLAMAALGIGQFGVLIALLNYGLQHVGAAQAAMIFSLFPLLTLLLSAALGRAVAMLASVGVLALLALSEDWPARVANLSAGAWAITGFIGVSSGVGYFLWLYALKHESPTRVTVFLSLNPVTAALLGAWLLGESLTTWAIAAMALIAIGLWLATRSAPPRQR